MRTKGFIIWLALILCVLENLHNKTLKKSPHFLLSPQIPVDHWLRALGWDRASVGFNYKQHDVTRVQL